MMAITNASGLCVGNKQLYLPESCYINFLWEIMFADLATDSTTIQ